MARSARYADSVEALFAQIDRTALAALTNMTDKEGTLRMMASGRWAIYRPGRLPIEITSGELFRVEVGGQLKLTRMEYRHIAGR
jgi:hypothetical protein